MRGSHTLRSASFTKQLSPHRAQKKQLMSQKIWEGNRKEKLIFIEQEDADIFLTDIDQIVWSRRSKRTKKIWSYEHEDREVEQD